jgi:hypothetical protein
MTGFRPEVERLGEDVKPKSNRFLMVKTAVLLSPHLLAISRCENVSNFNNASTLPRFLGLGSATLPIF